MDYKQYDLNSKKYIQRPLVLGQIQQLLPLIEGMSFPEGADAVTVAKTLGEKLNRALAVALLEKGVDEPEPEKIAEAMGRLGERSVQIAYSINAEQILEVIEDFFDCNRASSVVERLGKTVKSIRTSMASISSASSGGSPEGTSPKGRGSSGA